jgi:hypothetical protein
MFPHRNIHKYTWTSPEGKPHNQTDHVLIIRRRYPSLLDVRSFRGADCDTDHYLVVEEVRERLAVSKRAAQKIDIERFNLKKLNEEEVKEKRQVTITNKFAALENFEDNGDINRALDNIRENIKFRPKRVYVIVNRSIINHGLMRNVQNWLIEGSRLKTTVVRPQMK